MTQCDAPECTETAVQPVTNENGTRVGYACSPECSKAVPKIAP